MFLPNKTLTLSISLSLFSPSLQFEPHFNLFNLNVGQYSDLSACLLPGEEASARHFFFLMAFKCLLMQTVFLPALHPFKDAVTICTLGIGTAFGESVLDNTPRHATIVTREFSELLRIEQREFRSLWEVRELSLSYTSM